MGFGPDGAMGSWKPNVKYTYLACFITNSTVRLSPDGPDSLAVAQLIEGIARSNCTATEHGG